MSSELTGGLAERGLGGRAEAVVGGRRFGEAWVAVPALGFLTALAASNGGYFPTQWGWSALSLLWISALTLVLRTDVRLRRLEVTMLAGFAGIFAWMLLSTRWTTSVTKSVYEAERSLVYVGVVLCGLLLVRHTTRGALLWATWGAVVLTSGYGLLRRLFPDRLGNASSFSGNRLSEPLTYWNAVGILAAMGTLLAGGLVARGRQRWLRVAAGASLVLTVPTLYFTFSRGAWLAILAGLIAMIALDTRRLQLVTSLLVVAPAPAIAVILGSREKGLTQLGSTVAQTAHDGHRYAIVLAVLAVVGAAATFALVWAEPRVEVSSRVRRAYAWALPLLVLALLVAVFARYGSPVKIVGDAYRGFSRTAPVETNNLNKRLFNFSSSGRNYQWRVAWQDFRDHPALGSGAGSYEQYWLQHQPVAGKVRDAHSLYLEVLAELGPIGLVLLLVALGTPIAAAARARSSGLVPVAFGAYVAYLLHAGVDWDWEMTSVTTAALFCGLTMVVAARGREGATLSTAARGALVVAAVALGGFAFVGLLGNSALSASTNATKAANYRKGMSEARKAIRWAPWSGDAWQALGEAQLSASQRPQARASLLKAVAKDPRNWIIWYDLGNASLGEAQVDAYLTAARLSPLSQSFTPLCTAKLLPATAPPCRPAR